MSRSGFTITEAFVVVIRARFANWRLREYVSLAQGICIKAHESHLVAHRNIVSCVCDKCGTCIHPKRITHQLLRQTGKEASKGKSLRSIYSSALRLRLTVGGNEADLLWRGKMTAAVLPGRRVAHREQVVIRGHSTLASERF
jgi:hypothetical protein